MNYVIVIDSFFMICWGMVLTSITVLFILLKQFHKKNKYFPNLYSKEDRKKIKSLIKDANTGNERKMAKMMMSSFYILNVFILLPIFVEIYLFSK